MGKMIQRLNTLGKCAFDMEACVNYIQASSRNVTGCSSSRQLFLDAAAASLHISGSDKKKTFFLLFYPIY